jgi:hypothetical protein
MKPNNRTSLGKLPRKLILQIIIIIGTVSLKAESLPDDSIRREKELKLSTGVWSLNSIDELYSLQRYSGSGALLGLSFSIQSNKNIHSLAVDYSVINRKPNISAQYNIGITEKRYQLMKSLMADFNYSYMRRLYSRNFDIYVSANWINSINQPQQEEAEIDFSSVAPGAMFVYNNSKHSIRAQFMAPLISLTYRNQYHISITEIDDNGNSDLETENLKIESLRNLKILYAQLSYRYLFLENLSAEAQYQFRYISDKTPRKLTSASGIYSISLIYKF